MRKIVALFVCALLVAGMAIPALAVTPTLEVPDLPEIPEIKVDLGAIGDAVADALTAEHTITYDFNGGFTFSFGSRKIAIQREAQYTETGFHTVRNIIPIKPFYKFCGWETPDGKVYKAGDTYYGLGNTKFVAIWERCR